MTLSNDERRLTYHVIFCMFLLCIGYLTGSSIPVAIAAWLLIMALLSLIGESKVPPKDPPATPPTGHTAIEGA